MAACVLLVTWIRHELSYDRFHEKADRLYRASLEYSFGGQANKTNVSPTALLPVLQKNFAESIVIGLPLSYWIIEKWFLSSFIYRITIGVWPFASAAFSCLIIAFATASYQAVKAALINPTETLRRE